jgi:glycerophosphoryl diester phosphodiesterase
LLGDVLDYCRQRGAVVNVEVKRDVPDRTALVRAVAREIGRHRAGPLLLSSFDPIMIAGLGALLPRVPTALLVHRSSYHDVMLRARPLTLATGMNVEHVLFTPARARVLQRPRFVCAWTVNSATDARRVVSIGVNGIITDDPAHILAALADSNR